jgi:hypothetical protein
VNHEIRDDIALLHDRDHSGELEINQQVNTPVQWGTQSAFLGPPDGISESIAAAMLRLNFQRCHPFRKIVSVSIGQCVVGLGVFLDEGIMGVSQLGGSLV